MVATSARRNSVITKHLVDPELRSALDAIPALDLSAAGLPATRKTIAEMFAATPVVSDSSVSIETLNISKSAEVFPVRILAFRPTHRPHALPAFLHIHGGGYVAGTPEIMALENRDLSADLQCAIFSVDYRLAPEARYPASLEDCYAALCWIRDNSSELGVDQARIGVKGESAGGGLAAGLALLTRDRGGPALAFQHLIYPMLDDRTCVRRDFHPFTGEFQWTSADNAIGWSSLLGRQPGDANVPPYAAAARADQLAGLPPTFINVGSLDLFLEEDMEYARRLTRAGVPVELHVYPGAFHGFDRVDTTARVSRAANRDSIEALRRALHG
jgi:triacylglycerol lipase